MALNLIHNYYKRPIIPLNRFYDQPKGIKASAKPVFPQIRKHNLKPQFVKYGKRNP